MMTRPKCEKCGHLLRILHLDNKMSWTCQCGDSASKREFTPEELIEYKDINKAEMTDKERRKEVHLRVEEKEAKVVANAIIGLAKGETKLDIAKENHVMPATVKKIEEEKHGEIAESRDFLVNEYLDIAKESARLMKKDEYNKLKNLDGYKLILAGKIAADAAMDTLGGNKITNVNIINFQALVERVDGNIKITAVKEKIEDKKKDVIDVDISEIQNNGTEKTD